MSMIARWPRWARILAVVVLAGAVIVGVPAIRGSMLRAAGWVLVVDDPVEPADIVVVAVDADGAGVLEAADLVTAVSPRGSPSSPTLPTRWIASSSAVDSLTKTRPHSEPANSGRLA